MAGFHKIKARLDECSRGTIELDGMPLNGVYRMEIETDAQEVTRVHFHLFASEIDIEADTQVEVNAVKLEVTNYG